MNAIRRTLCRLRTDQKGATAIEYGVMLLFIATGLMIVIDSIGSSLVAFFDSVSDGF